MATGNREEAFFAENDPYGDRFSKPLPGWCCLVLIAVPATILIVFVKRYLTLIGVLGALLILWPVGILAKRRADRTDYGPS